MRLIQQPPTRADDAEVPAELQDLMNQIRSLPEPERRVLEPYAAEALEQARFRTRVLLVARDALERLSHDLVLTRFDLEATRRERESLLKIVDGRDD